MVRARDTASRTAASLPMSGRGAPLATATAISERARSARVAASTCPDAASRSIASEASTTKSKASPRCTRFIASTPPTATTSTGCRACCAYASHASASTCRIAIDEMPLSPLNVVRVRESGARSIDVSEPRPGERLAHLVNVEAEDAARERDAPFVLAGFARGCRLQRLRGERSGHDDDAVVVGDDDIARIDDRAGTDDRNVHRPERRLRRPARRDCLAPDGKRHLREPTDVAHAGVDDETARAARLEARREQLAEVTVAAVGRHGGDHDVAVTN